MAEENPFTPGFGVTPRLLALSGQPVVEFEQALTGEGSVGGRHVLISGPRGTGKTVLLSQLQEAAHDNGWVSIDLPTASSSLLDALRGEVVAQLRELDPGATSSRVTAGGLSAFGAGVQGEREMADRYAGEPEPTGRLLDRLAALQETRGSGVMIAIDEVQSARRDQLHEVTQHVQGLTRRGHAAAFAAAGIRVGVDDLLSHEKTTFLRRARQFPTGSVDVGVAAQVIQQTVAGTGKSITPEAAVRAGEVSQGYPYLIQVVGARAWQHTKDASTIELEDVKAIRRESIGQMIRDVHQPALRDLSPGKLAYLAAMLDDDGPTRVADVEDRLGKSPGHQSVYRDRLINDEMIRPAQRGYVELAMPYLREALLERVQGTQLYTRAPAASVSAARRPGAAAERSHLDRGRSQERTREGGNGR